MRVVRVMVEFRGMGEFSFRIVMLLGNLVLDLLYWGCCGRIRDVLVFRLVLFLECVYSKIIKFVKECIY